jgi:hypothetical protein
MKWLLYVGIVVVMIPLVMVAIGWALPKEHVARKSISVRASPADVFTLISGPSDWRGMKYQRLSESPLTWRETETGGDAITYERVETLAPERIVNRIADPKLPFGGSWTYQVKPAAEGTELIITENGEVYNPLFRFVSRFIMGHTATLEKYQRDLEAHFR